MKHVIWKVFVDYENEEKWLNAMSAKGMAMTAYTWCRYVFEHSPENEYTYRIELLNNSPSHAESAAYLGFLEENGIECIDTYLRWVYLRKKSSEGEFDIYSDLASKIKHYKRIRTLWGTLTGLELFAGFFNIFIGSLNLTVSLSMDRFPFVNIALGALLIAIGVLLLGLTMRMNKKINMLRKEKTIRE